MSTRPHTDWPLMARAVLDHYSPPIDSSLLEPRDKLIQESARATLQGLVASSFNEIRDGIIDLRDLENVVDGPSSSDEETTSDSSGDSEGLAKRRR